MQRELSPTVSKSAFVCAARVVIVLVLSCVLTLLSAFGPQEAYAAASPSVTMTRAATGKLTMKKGAKYNLGVKATTGAKVSYKSSRPSVVKVLGAGKIKALKAGKSSVAITASKSGKTVTKRITVVVVEAGKYKGVKSISPKPAKSTISVGTSTTIKTTFNPSNASNKNLLYKSTDTKILTVSAKGVVKGIKAGKAKVHVTSASNAKAVKVVTITVTAVKTPRYVLKYDFNSVFGAPGLAGNTSLSGKYVGSLYVPRTVKDHRDHYGSSASVQLVDGSYVTYRATVPGTELSIEYTQGWGATPDESKATLKGVRGPLYALVSGLSSSSQSAMTIKSFASHLHPKSGDLSVRSLVSRFQANMDNMCGLCYNYYDSQILYTEDGLSLIGIDLGYSGTSTITPQSYVTITNYLGIDQ